MNANRLLDSICEADASRPFVIAQLGQSLDGRIALPSGESKYINGPAALDHLHRLRAAVDAVVVGIGTVLADDPRLTVRRVEGRNPARVIIDPNGRLPASRRCLAQDGGRVILLRKRSCRAVAPVGIETLFIEERDGGFRCETIVQSLAQNGFARLLIEGGAATVSRFLEERQLDRIHLMVGPVFLGAGKTGVNLSAPGSLASALRVKPDVYRLEGGDVLFDCALTRE